MVHATAGYAAYAIAHATVLKGGALEKEALLRAARLLDQAKRDPGNKSTLGDALSFNLDLWTIFQADIADPANSLPEDLKQQLWSLSQFMDSSVSRLLTALDTDTLQAMIDVNRTLASANENLNLRPVGVQIG